jgi:hypothetical protein
VDEAILQLEMAQSRSFLVFNNVSTGHLCILQRRKTGYGLVELNIPG